ncbi:Ni/Fe hydrogenase subunit alpha [Noviherbaspirillum agri]
MISKLETAAQPDNLRRVAIEPVSRVEGHGKVTILLDDNNEVHQVRLHIVEFRGFEKFIEGRPYWEVPVMVQRLCGICPVSHNLAASKALDLIVGAKQITPAAEKLRRLMHYGQMLQSHALHLYHLCSPDLLFGFDSDVTLRNIVAVARQYPDTAKRGILLRKYGQEVIRMTSGKRVHGTGCIPGGMNKSLSIEERNALKKDIDDIVAWGVESVKMVKDLHRQNPGLYDHFGTFRSGMMSLSGKGGALDFYDGALRVRDDKGAILFDNVNFQQYETLIEEEVRPWSYMKFPYLKSIGPENGWYRVGPLSRIQNCDFISTPLAEAERKEFIAYSEGPIHAPLGYHWTRMIELLHAAEVIRDLLDDADLLSQDLVVKGERAHEGVGVIEAPRGTLFHHYQVDDNDLVTMCNLIVSTTNNNQAMNESIRTVARQYLNGKQITEGLLNHIEVAIRAFDPCLSCATHALGKMSLTAELVDVEGKLVHSLTRE